MFESIINFFKKLGKKEQETTTKSKDAAKERLHLVLMQDRANVSADFLDLMKQEIIEVIKKYIDVDENAIDVRLTNKTNGDGTTGAPALYANIPIVSIKEEVRNKIARENDAKAEHIVPDKKEEKEQKKEEQPKQEKPKESKPQEANTINKEIKDLTTEEKKEEKAETKVETVVKEETIVNTEKKEEENKVTPNNSEKENTTVDSQKVAENEKSEANS